MSSDTDKLADKLGEELRALKSPHELLSALSPDKLSYTLSLSASSRDWIPLLHSYLFSTGSYTLQTFKLDDKFAVNGCRPLALERILTELITAGELKQDRGIFTFLVALLATPSFLKSTKKLHCQAVFAIYKDRLLNLVTTIKSQDDILQELGKIGLSHEHHRSFLLKLATDGDLFMLRGYCANKVLTDHSIDRHLLKTTLETITSRIKVDEHRVEELRATLKGILKEKQKARTILVRIKETEKNLHKLYGSLTTLETLQRGIESAEISKGVVEGLERGARVLETTIKESGGIERVEEVVDRVMEGLEDAKEIEEVLGGLQTVGDERDIEDELEKLVAEEKIEEEKRKQAAAFEETKDDRRDKELDELERELAGLEAISGEVVERSAAGAGVEEKVAMPS